MKVYEEGQFHEGNSGDVPIHTKLNNVNTKNVPNGRCDVHLDNGYHSGSGRSSIIPHSPSSKQVYLFFLQEPESLCKNNRSDNRFESVLIIGQT